MGLSYDAVQPGQRSFVVLITVMENHFAEVRIALASSGPSACVFVVPGTLKMAENQSERIHGQ